MVRCAGYRRQAAFTLIELLTVITIILLLAGLVLGLAGNAQTKAGRSRATGEIQAMSAAANNYQIDNGAYPRFGATDYLNARVTVDPSGTNTTSTSPAPVYADTSEILYRLLSGFYFVDTSTATPTLTVWATTSAAPKPQTYFAFKDSQLKYNGGNVTRNPADVVAIADPFGLSYGYSTAYQADVDNNVSPPVKGYNPTYDLWSTGGYSATGGKNYPSDITTVAQKSGLWLKNW